MVVYIGTAGYHYDLWKNNFYNNKKNQLEHYLEHFNSVEINNTYYRLPSKDTCIKWKDQIKNKNFIYSVKVNRMIINSAQKIKLIVIGMYIGIQLNILVIN
jgi:uncharacterized protein YecE (DUF72 family)